MRYLIVLIVIMSSCSTKSDNSVINQTSNHDSLINKLVDNDFLIYTDSSKIDSVRLAFIKDGYIFSSEINRYVHIDAEELAEGSFDFFKPDLIRILNKREFVFDFATTENFDKRHEVLINNETFVLFEDKNLADYSFWDVGARRFFETLNQELEKNNVHERFYLLYGGNDLGAILLTDKQFEIIKKINEGDIKETPYKP